jgi:glycosyltransferase involved in cell wall biosynthesis
MSVDRRALLLWDSDYPWDIRVEKICTTLSNAGWEMHLVCRNGGRQARDELCGSLRIHRISALSAWLGRMNSWYGFPFFLSPVWLSRLREVVGGQRVNLIVVRDLPMAPAAVLVGKMFKIPVILDMAECYPELVRLIWRFETFRLANLLVRNPYLADLIEGVVLKNVDRVWVMVEESGQRLLARGFPREKITLVSNTPEVDRFSSAPASFPGGMKAHRGKIILLYVGFLTHSRGLAAIINALPVLLQERSDLFLMLVGAGTAAKELRQLARRLGVQEQVAFEGWVDNRQVPQYVASADICLVPHHKSGHWDHTIPNKLFDYMAAGKAVLASDARPMTRIINEAGCGLIYRDGDQKHLVAQALRLFDPALRHRLGAKGLQAIEKKYNWQQDAGRMLASMEGLLARPE